jgi:hypothetical protein
VRVFPTNNLTTITSKSAFISYVSLIICRFFFNSRSSRRRSRSCKNKDAAMLRAKSFSEEEERVVVFGFVERRTTGKIDEE